ncbi:MAG: hypothetical protein AB1758_25110 [Candidatus Eremiobacterota bacterium]
MRNKRGFILLLVMLLIPLCFLLMFMIVRLNIQETHYAMTRTGQGHAFFLAESGLQVGYDAFAASNFSRTTNLAGPADTPGLENTGANRLVINTALYPGMTDQGANGYVWIWNRGDNPLNSFSSTGRPEGYQIQVWFDDANPAVWHLRSSAFYGNNAGEGQRFQAVHELSGSTDQMLKYAIFDNGDLSEFVRGPEQTVYGKVHANGDLYIRPSNGGANALTLRLNTYVLDGENLITTAGKVIRHKDAWERNAVTSGTVKIEKTTGNYEVLSKGNGLKWSLANPLGSYDSFHQDWTKPDASGATQKFANRVKDGSLGQTTLDPPNIGSLEPGGYYQQQAQAGGLEIKSSTTGSWISQKTFYNNKEERSVTVWEVDVQAMAAAGKWPNNGLIYSEVPLRFVNAGKFPNCSTYPVVSNGLTVATNRTIYTKGDFNDEQPTNYVPPAGGDLNTPPVALMTTDRIYHLSNGFNDAQHTNNAALKNGADDGNKIEIHAALIDGAPTVDEIGKVTDTNIFDAWEKAGMPPTDIPYAIDNPNSDRAWANSDDYLENLSALTVTKLGTIVHLQNATMPQFSANPSTLPAGVTPWIYHNHYSPPTRDYRYARNGQAPPFIPNLGVKAFWRQIL